MSTPKVSTEKVSAGKVSTETRLAGIPISGGTVVGKVCLLNENRHSNLAVYKVDGEGVIREKRRVQRAIDLAAEQLNGLIDDVAERIGPAEAQIFEAQQAILHDSALIDRIVEIIEDAGVNAEAAVTRVLDGYEAKLLELDNEYIQERASDIGEIRRRLLDVLADMNPALQCSDTDHCERGRGRIVVAEELTASLAVELDGQRIIGFVTERGGPTSHGAILARALGVPAVCGIRGIRSMVGCGTELLVDGDTGDVVTWPDRETIARAQSRPAAAVSAEESEPVEAVPGLTVLANVSNAIDTSDAVAAKAEGIGLYRTEFEFLAAGRVLSEAEQLERYADAVRAMDGRPVCFRALDFGADKGAPLLDLPQESNPYLGLRGARLLLKRPELWRPQARALAAASAYGSVDVLYPMVVDAAQFLELKRVFCEALDEPPPGVVRHGVMFEVPSACLAARELLDVADFGSIGTNDLIQYLFAVDRDNEFVADDHTPDHPVFWSVLGQIAAAAEATRRTVSVCGEAAGNPAWLPKLIELGLTTLSVSPRFIAGLRRAAGGG